MAAAQGSPRLARDQREELRLKRPFGHDRLVGAELGALVSPLAPSISVA